MLSDEGRARLGGNAENGVSKARAWQRTHLWPTDLDAFTRDIWPRLKDLTARDIAKATRLSLGYCRRIQKGEALPHPMWWAAFEVLVEPEAE